MKATIKKKELREFTPFILEIEIQNMDELKDLWHRFNAASVTFLEGREYVDPDHHYDARNTNIQEVWEIIDEQLTALGCRRK